jgi:hypothetical protein
MDPPFLSSFLNTTAIDLNPLRGDSTADRKGVIACVLLLLSISLELTLGFEPRTSHRKTETC